MARSRATAAETVQGAYKRAQKEAHEKKSDLARSPKALPLDAKESERVQLTSG